MRTGAHAPGIGTLRTSCRPSARLQASSVVRARHARQDPRRQAWRPTPGPPRPAARAACGGRACAAPNQRRFRSRRSSSTASVTAHAAGRPTSEARTMKANTTKTLPYGYRFPGRLCVFNAESARTRRTPPRRRRAAGTSQTWRRLRNLGWYGSGIQMVKSVHLFSSAARAAMSSASSYSTTGGVSGGLSVTAIATTSGRPSTAGQSSGAYSSSQATRAMGRKPCRA